jgi:hypothetical protein
LADEPLTEDDGELCLDLEPFARPAFPFLSSISRTSRRRGSPSRSRGGSGHRAAAALERAARDLGVQLYYHAIDSQRIPDAATVRGFDALEDVLFVGYPSGVWDQVNLMPILRRGTTATPLELEFEGHKQFLIDAAVYPGSSGSPVFVVRDDPLRPRGDAARTIWFAGVIAAVFFREEANQRLGRCRRRPRLSPSVPR